MSPGTGGKLEEIDSHGCYAWEYFDAMGRAQAPGEAGEENSHGCHTQEPSDQTEIPVSHWDPR